jgi:hypothetical protein
MSFAAAAFIAAEFHFSCRFSMLLIAICFFAMPIDAAITPC